MAIITKEEVKSKNNITPKKLIQEVLAPLSRSCSERLVNKLL